MRGVWFLLACVVATVGIDAQAQRRGAGRSNGGSATLAVFVADPAGTPLPGVMVTLDGPTQRSARTEGGKIAFEGLPPGSYRLRFEHNGFITLERELPARSGPPIDVKVTLNRAPEPPPSPPARAEPPPKPEISNVKPAVFDVPAVFEKEYIGRGTGKMTPLACGSEGSSTLIQVKERIAEHTHAESDEFLYVIGGEGTAQVAGRAERLKAGVLVFVPRGVVHALSASGRNPLVVVSTRAGEGCADAR